MLPAGDFVAATPKSCKHFASACVETQVAVCNPKSSSIPRCGLVFLVLIALLSFSISVRVSQVNGVLHRSNGSTISNMSTKTKTDVPAAAPIQFETALQVVGVVLPQPRLTRLPSDTAQLSRLPLTESLWYSVAVQHRPPPFSLLSSL
jgi:hypothetical protein